MLETVTALFGLVCGQNPDHTWVCGCVPLPLCQRCAGLYAGAAIAALLHFTLRPRFSSRFLEAHGLFLALMIPFGFHWVPQNAALRTMTGVLFGFGLVTFLKLNLGPSRTASVQTPGGDRPEASRWYFIGPALTAALVPWLGSQGSAAAAPVLWVLALVGMLVLAWRCAVQLTLLARNLLGFFGALNRSRIARISVKP